MVDGKKLNARETQHAIHDAMLAVFQRTYTVDVEEFAAHLAGQNIVLVRVED